MQSTLGKIKKITDLRSVWAHEEYDFSQWLAEEENLALLSDAVGIDIMLEELESAVGGFSVDLYASEEGTGRRIIIENQLEDTNHDHLGKIITYASGKDEEKILRRPSCRCQGYGRSSRIKGEGYCGSRR